jgi:hypothetical protein
VRLLKATGELKYGGGGEGVWAGRDKPRTRDMVVRGGVVAGTAAEFFIAADSGRVLRGRGR